MSETAWDGVAGKQLLITGATAGIGLAAARALAAKGAHIALVGRDRGRADAAAAAIDAAAAATGSGSHTTVFLADLTSQADVRRLAADVLAGLGPVHVLVNNAGAVFSSRRTTTDGVEATWALNHLAPWLLTNLLLERLRESAPARVITTSSEAGARSHLPFGDVDAERSWGERRSQLRGFRRYGETKLANIAFTIELARRCEGTGVEAFCFHPGLVASNFNLNNGPLVKGAMALVRPFARSTDKGAETLVWLAESSEPSGQNGSYFADRKPRRFPPGALEADSPRRLWELSERQTGGGAAAPA
jgi:NAD(P)-dependent dehydrogenase (short-subunit alcohol dehydrogenase family)